MLNQVLHHSPSHVQIPPPSIDSFHQIPFMHHNVARTVTEIVHNLYSGFVPSIRPLQQQQVHPHQAVHVRLQQYIPAETPVATQGTGDIPTKILEDLSFSSFKFFEKYNRDHKH